VYLIIPTQKFLNKSPADQIGQGSFEVPQRQLRPSKPRQLERTMPQKSIPAELGGSNTSEKIQNPAKGVNTNPVYPLEAATMLPLRFLMIESDTAHIIGGGRDLAARERYALAINPAAGPELLMSAGICRLERARALCEPLAFLSAESLEELPSDTLSGLFQALSEMQKEAQQLIEQGCNLAREQLPAGGQQ
jgi:hypothetical protein